MTEFVFRIRQGEDVLDILSRVQHASRVHACSDVNVRVVIHDSTLAASPKLQPTPVVAQMQVPTVASAVNEGTPQVQEAGMVSRVPEYLLTGQSRVVTAFLHRLERKGIIRLPEARKILLADGKQHFAGVLSGMRKRAYYRQQVLPFYARDGKRGLEYVWDPDGTGPREPTRRRRKSVRSVDPKSAWDRVLADMRADNMPAVSFIDALEAAGFLTREQAADAVGVRGAGLGGVVGSIKRRATHAGATLPYRRVRRDGQVLYLWGSADGTGTASPEVE